MSHARNLARLIVHSNGAIASEHLIYAPNPILPGTIAYISANSTPTGWLKANGAEISRTTYSALFDAIGTTFGSGDGSTTFNLPDLRGEFLRGWDDERGVDSGRSFGSAQGDDNKSHSHSGNTSNTGNHSHSGSSSNVGNHTHGASIRPVASRGVHDGGALDIALGGTAGQNTNHAGGHSHNISTSNTGGHAHSISTDAVGGEESRPRNVALLACIKT